MACDARTLISTQAERLPRVYVALPLGAAATKLGLADGQEAEAALVDAVATGALGVLRVDDARRVARFDGAAPAFASEQQVAAAARASRTPSRAFGAHGAPSHTSVHVAALVAFPRGRCT